MENVEAAHLEKLLEERDELTGKLERLEAFLSEDYFNSLGIDGQLLYTQRFAMRKYLETLNRRIDFIKGVENGDDFISDVRPDYAAVIRDIEEKDKQCLKSISLLENKEITTRISFADKIKKGEQLTLLRYCHSIYSFVSFTLRKLVFSSSSPIPSHYFILPDNEVRKVQEYMEGEDV